jgi:apolipoprotein N-acyltransferase
MSGAYGAGGWIVSAWWLSAGITSMNSSYWWAGYASVLVLALIGSLPYIALGLISQPLQLFAKAHPKPILAAALVTLFAELWPTPFPGTLVNGISSQIILVQTADIGGTPLVHFLLYTVGFLLADVIDRGTSMRRRCRSALLLTVVVATTYAYGALRLAEWRVRIAALPAIQVGLAQPNIPVGQSSLDRDPKESLEALARKTREMVAKSSGLDLVVWPEIPVYFAPFNAPRDREFLSELLRGTSIPLLASADLFANEQRFDRIPFYNAVQLFVGDGEVRGEYRKMKLVPMGEYLPFEEYLTGPTWREFLQDVRRYAPGRELSVVRISPDVAVGTPICLEALHSDHVGAMIRRGARLLVNPSNDAYFGDTAGPRLNFSFSRFRAIEYRTPLIRVTNSGVSAAIDQTGEIVIGSLLPQFETASAVIEVHPSAAMPGRLLPRDKGILIVSFISLGALMIQIRKRNGSTSPR